MSIFEHSDYCVGIDLGTTNSAIATCAVRDGKIKSVVTKTRRIVDAYSGRDETEQYAVLPSCVYYRKGTDNEYTPIVGNFARRYANVRPELVAKSIKLQMGETKIVYPEWDENILRFATVHNQASRELRRTMRHRKQRFCPLNL